MTTIAHPARRVVMAAAMLAVALLCAPRAQAQPDIPASPEATVEDLLFDQARNLWDQRQRAAAVPLFQNMVRQFPQSRHRGAVSYYLGTTYMDDKKLDAAKRELEFLRTQCPDAPPWALGNGLANLAKLYLDDGDLARANDVYADLTKRLPGTPYLSRVAQTSFVAESAKNPDQALARLDAALAAGTFARADQRTLVGLKLRYLETNNPSRFLAEASAAVPVKPAPHDQDDVTFMADIAARLYRPLVAAGRLDEARDRRTAIDALLIAAANPKGMLESDARAYWGALEATNPARLCKEAQTAVADARTATDRLALTVPCEAARRAYRPMMDAGQLGAAEAMHQQLGQCLAALGLADLARNDDLAYLSERLGCLEKTNRPQFLTEAVAAMATVKTAPNADTAGMLSDLATRVYPSLFEANRFDDAAAAHAQFAPSFERLGMFGTKAPANESAAYLDGMAKADPVRYLVAVTAALEGITRVKNRDELGRLVDRAPTVYDGLVRAGRLADAERLHAAVAAALGATKAVDLVGKEDAAYRSSRLCALEQSDPGRFIVEALAFPATLGDQVSDAEAETLARVAKLLFPALCRAQRYDDLAQAYRAMCAVLPDPGAKSGNNAAADIRNTYAKTVNDLIGEPAFRYGASDAGVVAMRAAYAIALATDLKAFADRPLRFVREHPDDTAGMLPCLSALANGLPKDDPLRPQALFSAGRASQRAALEDGVTPERRQALCADADRAFAALIKDYPKSDLIPQALTGVVTANEMAGNAANVEQWLQRLEQAGDSAAALAWLAGYNFAVATPAALAKAATWYGKALTVAPKDARAALWQFRLAYCLEGQGRVAEATAAYQRVVDAYPESSCVVAAIDRRDQMAARKTGGNL